MNHLCLIGALREGTAIDAPIVGWVPPLLTGYVTCESARVEPIRTCGIGTQFANFGDPRLPQRSLQIVFTTGSGHPRRPVGSDRLSALASLQRMHEGHTRIVTRTHNQPGRAVALARQLRPD